VQHATTELVLHRASSRWKNTSTNIRQAVGLLQHPFRVHVQTLDAVAAFTRWYAEAGFEPCGQRSSWSLRPGPLVSGTATAVQVMALTPK